MHSIQILFTNYDDPQSSHNTAITALLTQSQQDFIHTFALTVFNDLMVRYGESIQQLPAVVVDIIKDDLCKALIEGLRVAASGAMSSQELNQILRLCINMQVTLKQHLQLQLEVIYSTLLTQVMDSKKIESVQQEIILKAFIELLQIEPSFLTDLFINYDCNLTTANVMDPLCRHLYKKSFPQNGTLTGPDLLSLEAMMQIIATVHATSLQPQPIYKHSEKLQPYQLLNYNLEVDSPCDVFKQMKQVKDVLLQGIEKFNKKPSEGLEFLQTHGLLPTPFDARAVAIFLRHTPGLNKTTIGKYIGDRDPQAIQVLQAFVDAFVQDYHSEKYSPLVSTVRAFLESFRPPGDSNVISRIMEHFANTYFAFHSSRNPSPAQFPFTTSDSVYVMCFSIIMLNVDLHNHAIKNKMKQEDYVKRSRDTPDTRNLPIELLEEIYHNIKNNEIKIPEENPDADVNENTWLSLIRRSRKAKFIDTSKSFELLQYATKEIFIMLWGHFVAALSVVLDTLTDAEILDKVVASFQSCAAIAANYNLNEIFDNLLISIIKFSTLSQITEYQLTDLMSDGKAQTATKLLFMILKQNASHLKHSWKNVLQCMDSLCRLKLLSDLFQVENMLGCSIQVMDTKGKGEDNRQGIGLGYFLDYYSWFPPTSGSSSPRNNDPHKFAMQLLQGCQVQQVFQNLHNIPTESLSYLLNAVMSACKQYAGDNKESKGHPPSITESEHLLLFYLDFLTIISVSNKDKLAPLWPMLAGYLVEMIRGNIHKPFIEEKFLNSLFVIAHAMLSSAQDQSVKVFDTLVTLNQLAVEYTGPLKLEEGVATAISKLILSHAVNIKSRAGWSKALMTLEVTRNKSASLVRLKVVEAMVGGVASGQQKLSKVNLSMSISLLMAYTRQTIHSDLSHFAVKQLITLLPLFPLLLEIQNNKEKKFIDEAWDEYWKPILVFFASCWTDTRPDIRDLGAQAWKGIVVLDILDRLTPHHCLSMIEKIILPLLNDLMRHTAVSGMQKESVEQLRGQGAEVLSRTFLHCLPKLTQLGSEFQSTWLKMLQVLTLYMRDSSENLKETVKESLKNILLVMTISGTLRPRPTEERSDPILAGKHEQDMWDLSWRSIDTCCPSLKDEVLQQAALFQQKQSS